MGMGDCKKFGRGARLARVLVVSSTRGERRARGARRVGAGGETERKEFFLSLFRFRFAFHRAMHSLRMGMSSTSVSVSTSSMTGSQSMSVHASYPLNKSVAIQLDHAQMVVANSLVNNRAGVTSKSHNRQDGWLSSSSETLAGRA